MKRINYKIENDSYLDDFLSSFHISKSLVYKLKLEERILVNSNIVKTNVLLKKSDKITILEDDITYKYLNNKKISVLYEDDDILIVNKENGIIIHGNQNDTLDNMVSYYFKDSPCNFSHIHRLDKKTTGIVLYSKNFLATSYLSYQMENRMIKKEYTLICENYFKKKEGTISLKIGQDRHENGKYRISSTGKDAITHYNVIEEKGLKSLVNCVLETGRTHQIRLHFSFINHPLIGDDLYGNSKGDLMLFSRKITFIHPRTRKEFSYEAPLPKNFTL